MRMSAEFYFFLQDVLNMICMVWYKQFIKQLRKLLLELIKKKHAKNSGYTIFNSAEL